MQIFINSTIRCPKDTRCIDVNLPVLCSVSSIVGTASAPRVVLRHREIPSLLEPKPTLAT
ncbi:unnamed protein product [Oppiella nova]|uniref:Uncharacterized protein n=1 Tax=Oppiella nova TaxID=334625 RepID=A0A7R9MDH9_9ACAR|nr:unnamed protein product [Oppiella nova]CAG2175300.1 unnamed protein product [Oppiella nova]